MPLSQLEGYAKYVSDRTGVDYPVVLTQMVQENGDNPPSTNNFANISYYGGQGQVGYFTSTDGTKIAKYATPKDGLDAYVNLLNTQYANISMAQGDTAQLKALQKSPWDASHYPTIFNTYKSVLSQTGGTPPNSTGVTDSTSGTSSGIASFFQSHSLLDWVLIGIAFIIILSIFF